MGFLLVQIGMAAIFAASLTPTVHAAAKSLTDDVPAQLARLNATQFAEPLLTTAPTDPVEDAALLMAIQRYQNRHTDDDYHALTDFLAAYPKSGWQVALLTNLGLSYYQSGRFSLAIDAWEKAWQLGKDVSEPHAKILVDRALGELMRMHARVGHAERLKALFAEMGDRKVSGSATEAVTGAREGLWIMQNDPGIAYLCGPMALKNLLLSQGAKLSQVQFLEQYRSGQHGVSLAEVGRLAKQAKIPATLIKREPGQAIPVPSIVHWKVSHYAAILGESQGRYHIQDPIFGQDLWVTRAALDEEASGYFLVPSKRLNAGWRKIQVAEADHLYGMGYTASIKPLPPNATSAQSCKSNKGMCVYNFAEMEVSLRLNDTPVGYEPPKGPAVFTTLTYNQRDAGQPATFSYFNISQKWTLNWLSFIQDNPSAPGAAVSRYGSGGGTVDYSGYNSSTGQFTPETKDQSVLVLTSSNPVRYERRLLDGSVEVYAQSNGSTSTTRLVFLTQLIDPFGNAVTLNYDGQLRLTSVIDVTGRNTTFTYGLSDQPLLITQITDPFGRSATLIYDSSGRLASITDVLGLTSSFQYDSASLINSMTTAYGTTTFAYGGDGTSRYLQATDPLGYTERLEFQQGVSTIPFSDPPATVPQGIIAPFNQYLNGRNTYYWDKTAYQRAAGNYTQARIKHWTHWMLNTSVTSEPVESIKYPLENRIWFNYPGQPSCCLGTAISGTYDQPTRQGRVLDDGTTQLLQKSYNSLGKPTHFIDALGRDTQITYADNQIDPIQIAQLTAVNTYTPGAQYTYNNQHLPLSYTDAAGQTTSYSYNSAGQLTQVTDALNHVTTLAYDPLGYLTTVTNADGKTQASFTYDAYGRVATRTDSEGYTLAYNYDNFDRLTQTTYPDGTTRIAAWDKLDLASVTDRLGRTTQYAHDAVRNLIAETDPLGHVIQYGYFPNQLPQSLTDGNGNITSWMRDIQGRVTGKQFADGSQWTYAYEATTSRLKSVTDALGQTKTYAYANDDRPAGLSYTSTVSATPNVGFSYDPWFPRIVQMTDGTGTTQYQYQPPGQLGALQLSSIDGPYANDTVGYQYDALGRMAARSVDSSSETFSYDALSRIIGHISPLGNFTRTYLGETGQLTMQQLLLAANTGNCEEKDDNPHKKPGKHGKPGKGHENDDGTSCTGVIKTQWQYDTNLHDRRLLAVLNSGNTRSFGYVTTPENLISQINESATGQTSWPVKSWNYSYDDDNRLEFAGASNGTQYSYGYDPADNLTALTTPSSTPTNFTVNDLNQIITANTQAYSYDANGNVTDDGVRTYLWDAENRLLQVNLKTQPGVSYQFRYDGLGRRVAIITTNGTTTETRYLWCGEKLCQSRTAIDTVSRHYYPEGEFSPPTGTGLYYSPDHLGSVRDVLNIQTGAVVASYDYDTYGQPIQSAGTTATDLRYAGLFNLQAAGLYLANYRAYDPETGRWLSRDPIGEDGGVNLYAYVNGNPVNLTDPRGLFAQVLIPVLPAIGQAIIDAATIGLGGAMIADSLTSDDELQQEIPKPPTGKGTASPDERDPVRLFPKDDKQECLDENGGTCDICGDDLDIDDAVGHHIKRWADGGRTTKDNLAITCKPCHKKLHTR
ncbi:RHS repeat-associated core domain-containing protein [Methylomicrobium lacus]|uniref:RHS repeat-associated core domain-containing protein n=1 Tax=Methylomicrobium lacus TaxID=136992 RepID=UPI0035A95704